MPDFSLDPYSIKIDKPWGYEIHWVPDTFPYMGKLIHIHAGKRLSLQRHDKKQESWFLISGDAKAVLEDANGKLIEIPLLQGKGYSCHIGQKHRLIGISDCDIIEVSTPEIGLTERLEDDYRRPHETEEDRQKLRN